jgi:4a-hydroxytetrahydrobiopterin dehydratase
MDMPKDWIKAEQITKTFIFKDFREAVDFVNKIVPITEEMDHHPDVEILYNQACIKITSHKEGNKVTKKDIELAKRIDKIMKD